MSEENPDARTLEERKSKNLLWVGIISIVMIFAGLTSAYMVVKSDNFWVEMKMPSWFIISTIVILVSSLTFYMALKAAKANNKGGVKLFMILTTILGFGFMLTQFQGWKELTQKGYAFVGPIKAPGTYGDNVLVTKNGKPIDFDGQTYSIQGEPLSEAETKELHAYFEALLNSDHRTRTYNLDGFDGYAINIFYNDNQTFKPFQYNDHKLYRLDPMGNKHEISRVQAITLKKFATNAVNDRGYFFMEGTYGEDFVISFRGRDLDYRNGKLYVGDNELSEEEYLKLEDTRNTASSFVYILSALHLLHLIGGLIYVLTVTGGALQGRYDSNNNLKIKLGSMFWHFLGVLWIYLYLFLTIIH